MEMPSSSKKPRLQSPNVQAEAEEEIIVDDSQSEGFSSGISCDDHIDASEIKIVELDPCTSRCVPFRGTCSGKADLTEEVRNYFKPPVAAMQKMLHQLRMAVQHEHVKPIVHNSENLMNLLINNLKGGDSDTKLLTLLLLTDIFLQPVLMVSWCSYVSSLMYHILEIQCTDESLIYAAEKASGAMVLLVPIGSAVAVISQLIDTSSPVLAKALELLVKLVRERSHTLKDYHLKEIMLKLKHIQSLDYPDWKYPIVNDVKDEALQCIAIIYLEVGEEKLLPYMHCIPIGKFNTFWSYVEEFAAIREKIIAKRFGVEEHS